MLVQKLNAFINYIKTKAKVAAGKRHDDSAASYTKNFTHPRLASDAFESQKKKLLNINEWGRLSGPENADFFLYEANGMAKPDGMATINSYVKIDLPGPLPMYWVKIEKILEQENTIEVILRPSEDPTSEDRQKTKHFFSSQTTNTLGLSCVGARLTAYHLGKNEIANNNSEEAGKYAAINTSVVVGGFLGIQQHQWNTFTKNLAQA